MRTPCTHPLDQPLSSYIEKRQSKPKDPVQTVDKKQVHIVLPFLGHQSKHITEQLKSCIKHFYGIISFSEQPKIQVIFTLQRKTRPSVQVKLKSCTKQTAGVAMISISGKRNTDYVAEK